LLDHAFHVSDNRVLWQVVAHLVGEG